MSISRLHTLSRRVLGVFLLASFALLAISNLLAAMFSMSFASTSQQKKRDAGNYIASLRFSNIILRVGMAYFAHSIVHIFLVKLL
jgi:hypothetical protein